MKQFEPKSKKVTKGWRKLHDEKLYSFNSSSNIIGMIKSSRMRWTGYVACTENIINAYKILVENLKGGDLLGTKV
jgi:hypothetical protein